MLLRQHASFRESGISDLHPKRLLTCKITTLQDRKKPAAVAASPQGARLELGQLGQLSSLRWVADPAAGAAEGVPVDVTFGGSPIHAAACQHSMTFCCFSWSPLQPPRAYIAITLLGHSGGPAARMPKSVIARANLHGTVPVIIRNDLLRPLL